MTRYCVKDSQLYLTELLGVELGLPEAVLKSEPLLCVSVA